MRKTNIERLEGAYLVDEAGCWIWQKSLDRKGYGQFFIGRNDGRAINRRAHRVVYEELVGPIQQGLDLDHLCRVTACVNPAHLEPVTRRVNLLRGQTLAAKAGAQTHCVQGHEFTPENTVLRADNGGRACRTCRRARDRVRHARKRVSA